MSENNEKIVGNLNIEDISSIFESEIEEYIKDSENRPPIIFVYSPDGGLIRSAEIIKVERDGGLKEYKIILEY